MKDRSNIFSYYNKRVEIHDSARKQVLSDVLCEVWV